jgi:hypothetical protein
MLDVAVSFNRYKFLGHEFLTWLWFLMEKEPAALKRLDPDLVSLEIGNRIVLENRVNESVESITIEGDDAGLEEGILALQKGAVVTEMNLSYQSGELKWTFTLKGESFNVSSLKPPDTGPVESDGDIAGAVLEKAFLYEKVMALIDTMFNHFVRLRVSDDWNTGVVSPMKEWIKTSS